jgi:hypothetical protein
MDTTTYSIAWTVIVIWALYLSFKRNKGFELGSFLVALIFPVLYIPYFYATQK